MSWEWKLSSPSGVQTSARMSFSSSHWCFFEPVELVEPLTLRSSSGHYVGRLPQPCSTVIGKSSHSASASAAAANDTRWYWYLQGMFVPQMVQRADWLNSNRIFFFPFLRSAHNSWNIWLTVSRFDKLMYLRCLAPPLLADLFPNSSVCAMTVMPEKW